MIFMGSGIASDSTRLHARRSCYREAGGIPRSINNLCDLCLFEGLRKEKKEIDGSFVKAVLTLT